MFFTNCSHVTRVGCRWRLPLWLLFFGGTVSTLTLLYLLGSTIYPAANPWMRFSSHSLIYRPGHSSVHVSYVEPGHVFKRISKSGSEDIIMPSTASMRRPSTSGPASLVDGTVRATEHLRHHSFAGNSVSELSLRLLWWFKSVSPPHHAMRNVWSLPALR